MKPPQGPACNDIYPNDTPEQKASVRFRNMVALSNYYETAGCPRADCGRVGDVHRIAVASPLSLSTGMPLPPVFHEFELWEAQSHRGLVRKLWRKKPFV